MYARSHFLCFFFKKIVFVIVPYNVALKHSWTSIKFYINYYTALIAVNFHYSEALFSLIKKKLVTMFKSSNSCKQTDLNTLGVSQPCTVIKVELWVIEVLWKCWRVGEGRERQSHSCLGQSKTCVRSACLSSFTSCWECWHCEESNVKKD